MLPADILYATSEESHGVIAPVSESNAVFLSYASEDAEPARRICLALRAAGIDVWFDQSELHGGDIWDAAIRAQVKACALFLPVISANSDRRSEGYFRLEWKLAVDRSHLMAADRAFLVPVVIDDTREAQARVPDGFRTVQWTSLPGGAVPTSFVERLVRLLAAETRTAPSTGLSLPNAPDSAAGDAIARRPMPAAEKSIAVLPFTDMSAQQDQEYFSDGLAEALIDLLAQVRDLHVPARTSSFSFKGKNADIATIAAILRVTHVLEGSVRKAGNTIRVSVRLIQAHDGYHVWSKRYDRSVEDIFEVQDEIAALVVEALRAQLLPAGGVVNAHRTVNTEAYEQYLLARQLHGSRTVDDMKSSVAALKRAISLDPDYGAAYALLGGIEGALASEGGDVAPAISAADKAVQLAPGLAEAYSSRSYLRAQLQWDWAGALSDIEAALQLDARSFGAQRRNAMVMIMIGRFEAAMAPAIMAVDLEPLDAISWQVLSLTYIVNEQVAAAIAAVRRSLAISPHSPWAIEILALALSFSGQTEEALAVCRDLPIAWKLWVNAITQHRLGHDAESRLALQELDRDHAHQHCFRAGLAHAVCGEMDEAFLWLERAYQQHDWYLPWIQYFAFYAPSLRADPRYAALLAKMGLQSPLAR